jgi:single-strand DNA-binding protein
MPSFQRCEIMGHLGKDPETKFTPSGIAKTTFSVAVSERWKDKNSQEWKEKTEWFNVVAWRKDWLANHLGKGGLVFVAGKIETRSYEGRDGQKRYITELIADQVIPIATGGAAGIPEPRTPAAVAAETDGLPLDDSDVPF